MARFARLAQLGNVGAEDSGGGGDGDHPRVRQEAPKHCQLAAGLRQREGCLTALLEQDDEGIGAELRLFVSNSRNAVATPESDLMLRTSGKELMLPIIGKAPH